MSKIILFFFIFAQIHIQAPSFLCKHIF